MAPLSVPKVGDRVRIVDTHRWKPGRVGNIIEIEDRTGARFVVRFDHAELGFYYEDVKVAQPKEGGSTQIRAKEPRLLRLSERDLEFYPDDK